MSFLYFIRRYLSAGCFLAIISFTGCSLFNENADQEIVSIKLPDWPPQTNTEDTILQSSYPPLSRWKITLAKNDEITTFYAVPETQIEISIQKHCPFSLQAAPVTLLENENECLYFHPAGYIYPVSSQNIAVWEQGYAAFIMECLYKNCSLNGLSESEAARYVSTFNWEKLNSIIQEKLDSTSLEDKKFYNPWLCDTAIIIKNLSNETFRTSLLSPSGCYQLSAQKIFETTGFSVLSQFIPENQIITKTGQITIKKDFPMLFSDAKNFGIFITYLSAKNIHMEYIYMPIYKESYE